MPTVTFFSASGPASGVQLSQLDAGTYDHIGYYASSGFGDQVDHGAAQDISWIVDDAGVGIGGGLAAAGQLNNNKWIDTSGVSIASGDRVELSSVVSSGSGTFHIKVTNASAINITNAKLYAYDGVDVNNDPSGIWVLSYEIIDVDLTGTGDSQWALIDSSDYNYLLDRSLAVGYPAATEFDYSIGLSIRPKLTATSGTQNFGLYFSFDYS